uniref:Uncharacterized protein n=1 Tax=Romanomermis culicivorax TaxID=13658 RepID=A0A915HV97_ROMCU
MFDQPKMLCQPAQMRSKGFVRSISEIAINSQEIGNFNFIRHVVQIFQKLNSFHYYTH